MNEHAEGSSTRRKLLDAARSEFAENGIAGGRVNRIAERAGVNKERIYGYFGSKEKLFDAVIMEALTELGQAHPLTQETDLDEYIGAVFDFHRARPDLLRLLMWESLHYRKEDLPSEEARGQVYLDKVQSLAQLLGREADARTAISLFTLIGIAAWPSTVPQLLTMVTGGTEPSVDEATLRASIIELGKRAIGA
ncbi:TetR/AcrR family transcriptional regulator [Rhodococcus oryzae]|uniref:TetR/AcrR family transcriptional regulator n=1 Tax=Rhodococcus oryzae TaxID=2571143 RepID=A0ABY2RHP0_9NOCA|nr:TetR family transcriptional regulator [Rhodococcus oryzae]TJZ76471.1 TetR/AcrR family transcriptional regulator [Rhodococcus oryzae]